MIYGPYVSNLSLFRVNFSLNRLLDYRNLKKKLLFFIEMHISKISPNFAHILVMYNRGTPYIKYYILKKITNQTYMIKILTNIYTYVSQNISTILHLQTILNIKQRRLVFDLLKIRGVKKSK